MKYDADILEAPLHNQANSAKEFGTRLLRIGKDRRYFLIPFDDLCIIASCFHGGQKRRFNKAVLDPGGNLTKRGGVNQRKDLELFDVL